ncbi:MAG: uracil-DNA glycosylase, partial [bacterium]|nr:uracil-DNA glycosylase [bacterium]
MTPVEIRERLDELAGRAAACTACRLHEGRTQAVFADGSPEADIMFIGEGPGYNEDKEGLPFVGKAGMLLNRLLREVGLDRREVYIANVVKCRPPNNRDPRPDEIEACKHFLVEQLRLVNPAVVMTMGNFSTKLLLKTSVGITRTRGQVYPWWGRVVIPTFHPAAALRSGPTMEATIRGDLELAVRTARERLADP